MSTGNFSNQWGPNGGGITAVGAPEPVMEACARGTQSINQRITGVNQSLAAQMSQGRFRTTMAESAVPAGPNMG